MPNNLRPIRPIASAKLTPELHGGLLINRTPEPIPWETYSACGVRVLHEGKIVAMVFEPQHITEVDESVALFRLLFSMQTPKPRPLEWKTVPENVRRHFRLLENATI